MRLRQLNAGFAIFATASGLATAQIPWRADCDHTGSDRATDHREVVRAAYLGGRVAPLSVAGADAAPPGMVAIPGGAFEMGDHFGVGHADERPVHSVFVPSFFMDVHEVANQLYCDYLNAAYLQGLIEVNNGWVYRAGGNEPYCATNQADYMSRIHWDGSVFSVTPGLENHPMGSVSWYGAAAYANWKSVLHGREPCYDVSTWTCDFSRSGFRLPTEAEWEYAARGGFEYYMYPWGNEIDGSKANYRDSGDPFETGDPDDVDAYPYTTPIGYYDGNQTPPGSDMANGYGLYDMAGNQWEWCNDWYDASYYESSPYFHPRGPVAGASRIIRGGSWFWPESTCRCALRAALGPEQCHSNIDFHLVTSHTEPEEIPALGQWGLTSMVLLLLTAGTIAFRSVRQLDPSPGVVAVP